MGCLTLGLHVKRNFNVTGRKRTGLWIIFYSTKGQKDDNVITESSECIRTMNFSFAEWLVNLPIALPFNLFKVCCVTKTTVISLLS